MPLEKVPAFLKARPCSKKSDNNRFRVPIHFATNRFTSEVSASASIVLPCQAVGGCEGTGTRPDCLANRADKKIEGPLREKNPRKSRNSRRRSNDCGHCTGRSRQVC